MLQTSDLQKKLQAVTDKESSLWRQLKWYEPVGNYYLIPSNSKSILHFDEPTQISQLVQIVPMYRLFQDVISGYKNGSQHSVAANMLGTLIGNHSILKYRDIINKIHNS
jgi:hypothetical protein